MAGSVLSLIVQCLALLLRETSRRSYVHAEGIRRQSLLEEGLGIEMPALGAARAAAEVAGIGDDKAACIEPYYEMRGSDVPFGPKRLLGVVVESCFFTNSLAKKMVWYLGGVVGLGVIVSVVVAFLVLPALSGGAAIIAARVAALCLAFCATGDIAASAMRFHALSTSSEAVLQKCEGFDPETVSERDALILADSYNCALAGALPIPSLVYTWHQASLNEAWRQRCAR